MKTVHAFNLTCMVSRYCDLLFVYVTSCTKTAFYNTGDVAMISVTVDVRTTKNTLAS